MTSLDDGWSGPPGDLDGGNFKCPDCPESFQTAPARHNHRRKDHRVEQHRDRAIENSPTEPPVEVQDAGPSEGPESDSPTDLAEIMDGLWIGSYYKLTYQFARALHTKVPDMRTFKKRQIIQAFDENASRINADHSVLDKFCSMAGLDPSQARFIKMTLFWMDDPQQSPYALQGQGSPQAVIWNPTTGQWVPLIFVYPDNQGRLWQGPYYYP